MALCQAIIPSTNRPCTCRARAGEATCGKHKNADVLMADRNMCGQEKADGSRCMKRCATGDIMCKLHRSVVTRREENRRGQLIWTEVLDMLWTNNMFEHFNHITALIDQHLDAGWITQALHDDLILQLHEEWRLYRDQRVAPIATDLQRLALDNQNVHTKEVTKQTTDAQNFLLKTSIPKGQNTLAEIEHAWRGKDAKTVLKDIRQYYKLIDCDSLYQRVLDGLWARIQVHPERTELIQRLWEETSESVTKCFQGHMSRLGNVMVGFTEEVKAEVPLGEILQNKMASIAAKDTGVLHKVCEAWFVCEELKVPQEERGVWIEAF